MIKDRRDRIKIFTQVQYYERASEMFNGTGRERNYHREAILVVRANNCSVQRDFCFNKNGGRMSLPIWESDYP